jgi:CPA2 family monovalent cation:H+ antiporter-2
MVLALVLLPALAPTMGGDNGAIHAPGTASGAWLALLITLAKVALFVVLALVVGTRVVPWLLMRVTRTGSRELFTLCVLAIASAWPRLVGGIRRVVALGAFSA